MIELAGCIIQNDRGEILLLHRKTRGRVQWELPGGKVKVGEEPIDAAAREVAEEAGVTLCNLQPFGETSFTEDGHAFRYHWFTAEIAEGVPQPLEDAFDEVRFIALADLESFSLSANMRQLLPQLRRLSTPKRRHKAAVLVNRLRS